MNFHVLFRVNPSTGNEERYFRLKESFRDEMGMVRNRTILTVGFDMNDIPMEDVRLVGDGLTRLHNCNGNRTTLFGDILDGYSEPVRNYIEKYWKQIVSKGRLDVVEKAKAEIHAKARRLVDVNTVSLLPGLFLGRLNGIDAAVFHHRSPEFFCLAAYEFVVICKRASEQIPFALVLMKIVEAFTDISDVFRTVCLFDETHVQHDTTADAACKVAE